MAVTARKPHSRDLVSAVLFLKLTASEKLVLMALCWHYPKIFPSVARIAALASRSERWVQRCLRILQGKGLIEVLYRRDGQAQDTSFYTICPDRILMQAGKRAKTTLKSDETEFRGVVNSVQGEGGELTSPKQRALDRANNKPKIRKKNTAYKGNEQPCQEERLASKENPISPNDGGTLTGPPYEEVNPCQEEVVNSQSNETTQPPISALPPSPSLPTAGNENVAPDSLTPEEAFDKAIEMSQHLRKAEEQTRELGRLKVWLSYCQELGARAVLEAFEYFLRVYKDISAQGGVPMVSFCVIGPVVFKEMQERKVSATKKAVTPSPPFSAPPSSPSTSQI